MKSGFRYVYLACVLLLVTSTYVRAQSLGNAGTIQGTVVDPSGAAVAGADVTLHNTVTGYTQSVKSASDGSFKLSNIPPNPYHLDVKASGFSNFGQDVTIRNAIPIDVKAALSLAGVTTEVNVEASAAQVELDPTTHVDVDRSSFAKLPEFDPGAGLSQAIVYSTGAVAADSNGSFHPLGDHAQVSFVIDGQPISDQQSKVYSTQLPTSAIQSMELGTGSPGAEFGDKTSLVAQVTTRSGLGATKAFGNIDATYGSFGNVGGSVAFGFGKERLGNFIAIDGVRSGRFLDTPEFSIFHDIGNNQTIFDRLDLQPTAKDALHLNLFAARNWIQIPNSYDQLAQDQKQRVLTWSFAPGFQHTFSAHALMTVNPYIRKDQFNYYPSGDLFADSPATQTQARQLMDWGVKSDISLNYGHHNIKLGIDLKQTRLLENFGFGVTDPTFNSPCIDASGTPSDNTNLTDPRQCARARLQPNVAENPNATAPFAPGLLPFDLTRGGGLFNFHATSNINQYAFYVQDAITAGNFLFNLGLRGDIYHGLVSDGAAQPRLGVAYNIKKTGTVLRFAYARTFETPFNENLLLSSAVGIGSLAADVFGASDVAPVPAGRRNQYNVGFQQAIGRFLLVDADYWWKFTNNAYDFFTLLNTTITFPVAWEKSKLDGITGRVSTTNIHGFQASWTVGHNRARYFTPQTGGLIFESNPGVFRIDHDQALQSTFDARYQRPRNAEWIAWTWRYDSGLVVSGVPDAGAALALTPNQQVTIGLACKGVPATVDNPFSPDNCASGPVTSKLIALPQGGYNGIPSEEDDDHNPSRVNPRHIFSLGFGTDNLLHTEGTKRIKASLEITNLTNQHALYNFLSTFSGTHFLAPRTLVAHIGYAF